MARFGREPRSGGSRKPRIKSAFRPVLGDLESRTMLTSSISVVPAPTVEVQVAPTAEEQYMLQLINRARSNPPAEARRLLSVVRGDPLLRSMSRRGNLAGFIQIMTHIGTRPPLAFNPRLIEAARDYNVSILATNNQQHSPTGYLTDSSVATANDGQAFYPVGAGESWATGENLFAYSQNVRRHTLKDYVDYYYAGLMLDWGNPDFGHLRNLLAPGPGEAVAGGARPYSEVGIGLMANAVPSTLPPANPENPLNQGLNVGPVLVTQEFGWHSDSEPALVGAVYHDVDGNQFYTPGEGLGGVTITAIGQHGEGTYQVQTWDTGGYTLTLPRGSYVVAATGGALPSPQSTVVQVGADNVCWDVMLPGAGKANRPDPSRPGRSQLASLH